MSLQSIELALIGAGLGGGIKHTIELKALNYKRAMQSLMLRNGVKRYETRRHGLINTMHLLSSLEVCYSKELRFS
jgi:hypothetical protein